MTLVSFVATTPRRERACLVAAALRDSDGEWSLDESLDELEQLARAADADAVARLTQRLRRPSRTYIGRGKIAELSAAAARERADVVIFDDELTPGQQKALEDALGGIKVMDRSGLILDVFARRARTREGKLQIELAQYEYLLPRLAGQWSHLERLGGGIGTRGPGEAQIETDRRLIRRRISKIRRDLERVRSSRAAQRRRRTRTDVRIVSLIGYTNAGKSELFNRLTSGGALARDQLFSTLDTTTRRLNLRSRVPAVLTDTVGFIRKLPAIVVAAFQATLEELHEADLLLHVIDLSHPLAAQRAQTVDDILDGMGLIGIPRILVLNKLDRITSDPDTQVETAGFPLSSGVPQPVVVSALKGWGVEKLRDVIDRRLARVAAAPAAR